VVRLVGERHGVGERVRGQGEECRAQSLGTSRLYAPRLCVRGQGEECRAQSLGA
jgi:hypothetical protein